MSVDFYISGQSFVVFENLKWHGIPFRTFITLKREIKKNENMV